MPIPTDTINAGAVNTAAKSGVTEFIFGLMSAVQSTNISAGDHIKYDTVVDGRGTLVQLDTTTAYTTTIGQTSIGRFLLKGQHRYSMRAMFPYIQGSGATGQVDFAWFDATNNVEIPGSRCVMYVASDVAHDAGGDDAETLFAPTQDTFVELRLMQATAILNIGAANRTPIAIVKVDV